MQVLETGERPDEPEELGLARSLSSIKLVVEEEKLVVDRADYAFVDKAPELIEGLGEAERAGDKAARIFVDCVRFMDSIEREYGLAGGGSLARTFGSLRSLLAEYLDGTHGITFAPDPRVEGSETPASLKALAGAKPVRFPSRSPAGEVIGLFKRGMATSSGAEPPEVLMSSGESSDALELVKKLSSVLTRPLSQSEDQRQAKARALKQIRHKYLPELAAAAGDADAGSRADREATALRYVVNVLVPLNRDGSLDAAVKPLCADLKERGVSQIPVRLGVTFDETFGTSKFERRTIPSEKALGVVAGYGGPAESDPPAAGQAPERAGRFFVCIIDTSASMRTIDVERYAEQGAQLAVALLGEGTEFGAVTFNSRARVQCRLRPVGGQDERLKLQKRLHRIPRMGNTNFIAALRVTRRMLEGSESSRGSGAVVFLTDGAHTAGGSEDQILDEIARFVKGGWPIYSIGLSKEAHVPTLHRMAARTGGAYFKAGRSEDLLAAFVDIVGATEGLLVKRGPFESATVMPGTKRLVYLIAKGGPSAKIGQVSVAALPVPPKAEPATSPAATTSPDVPGGAPGEPAGSGPAEPAHRLVTTAVEVQAFDGPRPGVWQAETTGSVRERVTLLRPSFTLDFVDGRPRSKYLEGQETTFALLARAEEPGGMRGLREHSELNAEVKSEASGEVIAEVPLEPVGEADAAPGSADAPFTFEGKTVAKLVNNEKEETQTARLVCRLGWAKGEPWTQEKIVSYQVAPAVDLFDLEPEKLDLGTLWSDSEPVSGEIKVTSRCEHGMFKVSADLPALSCDPPETLFASVAQESITVTLDPSKVVPSPAEGKPPVEGEAAAEGETPAGGGETSEAGAAEGAAKPPVGREVKGLVTVSLDYGHVENKRVDSTVPVTARMLRFEGGDVQIAGCKAGTPVSHALEHKVSPEVELAYELGPLVAARVGPDKAPPGSGPVARGIPGEGPPTVPTGKVPPVVLELADVESGKVIKGVVPADAAAGTYVGPLTISVASMPEAEAPAPRKLRVFLAIGEPEPRITVTEAREGGARLESLRVEVVRSKWNEATVRIIPERAAGAQFVIDLGNLTGPRGAVIAKPFCIASEPKGDWDGTDIREGGKHDLTYRVYVSSDLPNGEYTGQVVMALVKDDRRTAELVLPVTVDVKLGPRAPAGDAPKEAPPTEPPPEAQAPPGEATIHVAELVRWVERFERTKEPATVYEMPAEGKPVRLGRSVLVVPHPTEPDENVIMTVIPDAEKATSEKLFERVEGGPAR
jgi:hypothetical protein